MQLFKVAALTLVLASAMDAQAPSAPMRTFEDEQIRVHEISLAAGQQTEIRSHSDALLIPLANDLDGRAPVDAATWRPAGTTSLDNRGATPFNALLVELVAPRSEDAPTTPPEAFLLSPAATLYPRAEGLRVRTVIDNPRVLVTAHRLPQLQTATTAWHWHSRELVLVYLGSGDVAGTTGQLDAHRVRRGNVDVLPANVPHAFQNMGNDPIEFLLISPK